MTWSPKLFSSDFKTTIKARFEDGKINANMPRVTTPYDNITPWFASSADGGAGKITVGGSTNGTANVTVYELAATATGYNPWLQSVGGQQTPTYFMSGTTGQTYRIYGGYINNAFLNNDGSKRGSGVSAIGQNYSEYMYSIGSYNYYQSTHEPNVYMRSLYLNKMLTDSSVFDYYNKLIDGDNKGEWADWHNYNLDFSQTALDDRLAFNLTYNFERYSYGSWSLLGGAPSINIDITQVSQDGTTNSNYGRPYVGNASGGTGTWTTDTRSSGRASLFAELRAADLTSNSFLVKLIGKHRFSGVASQDSVRSETRNYNRYAASNAWDAYWSQANGLSQSFKDRPPYAVMYLGNSLAKSATATGADIPALSSKINLDSGNIYLFDSTWTPGVNAAGTGYVLPSDAWNGAASSALYQKMFVASQATTQASNPANYKGWTADRYLDLMSYDSGDPLYTSASKSQRVTTSLAGTWQGYMWKDAFVPTIGWRYDEVKTRSVNAQADSTNKSFLKLDGSNYAFPSYTPASYYKGHSVSGGAVLHLNGLLPASWDKDIPLNVALTYNNSSNFQVGGARVDMFNHPIANPQGKTKEYGVTLSTKDERYSFRVTEYKTQVQNATISTDSGFFGTIQQGLKFRNVFLYQLSNYYPASTVGFVPTSSEIYTTKGNTGVYNGQNVTYGTRWFWTPAYVDAQGHAVQTKYYSLYAGQTLPAYDHLQTWSEAIAQRDASINAWNDIQKWLAAKGFFSAWGMTVQPNAALTDRATYEASVNASGNPSANTPANSDYTTGVDASTVYAFGGGAPNGFAITGDQESKGYEFELTANITQNWRLSFNASKTTAINMNIGGQAMTDFVDYMDTMIAGAAGEMRQYNGDYQANNSLRKKWADWRATWTWQKLQEKTTASELRKWHYNVVTNYSFTKGWMKGVGVGAAYRWQDKVVIGYPISVDSNGYTEYDLAHPIYGPSEDGLDMWVSYERKLTKDLSWKIQLNVRNAFQNDGLVPISVEPDGKTWAGVRIKPVQEWALTNTIMF